MDEQTLYSWIELEVRQYLYETPIYGGDYRRHADEIAERVARVVFANLPDVEPGDKTTTDTGLY